GLFATLFWKGTHFWRLNSQLKNLNKKKLVLLPFFLCLGLFANAQDSMPADSVHQHQEFNPNAQFAQPGTLKNTLIDAEHAKKFGKLLVQDIEGRIKPMDTH